MTLDQQQGVSYGDSITIWRGVHTSRAWLDAENGSDQLELTCRVLKVAEEAGEAAQAWIGMLGQNPSKGITHTRDDVVAELADVAFTALVAIASLDHDPNAALTACADKVLGRLADVPPQTRYSDPGSGTERRDAQERVKHPESATIQPSLIIVRGNSGSGKSTVAREVRERYGRGCALLELSHRPLGVRDVHEARRS